MLIWILENIANVQRLIEGTYQMIAFKCWRDIFCCGLCRKLHQTDQCQENKRFANTPFQQMELIRLVSDVDSFFEKYNINTNISGVQVYYQKNAPIFGLSVYRSNTSPKNCV